MSAPPASPEQGSGRSTHFVSEIKRAASSTQVEISAEESAEVSPHKRDLIAILIKENEDIWKELLDNRFCRAMKEAANDDLNVLRGFEWYMMQDYYYVANLIDYEAARVPKARTVDEHASVMKRVADSVRYTDHFFRTVTAAQPTGLGISASAVLRTKLSGVLKNYIKLITSTAENENEVLSLVVTIAGLQSYYAIASDLYRYSAHHDTLWYKFWAKDNFGLGKACLVQQKFFIDNYKSWKDDKEKITKLFRETCKAELDLWNEALQNSA
jgi:thiaminase